MRFSLNILWIPLCGLANLLFNVNICDSKLFHGNHGHPKCDVEPCYEKLYDYSEAVKVEIRTKCPPGYEFDGWRCIEHIRLDPILRCRDGHRLVDGKCYESVTVEPGYECAAGNLLAHLSKCEIIEEEDAKKSCRHGYEIDELSNLCVKAIYHKPMFACPNGYTLRKNKCIAVRISYDRPTCASPFEAMETSQGNIECVQKLECEPQATCPYNYELIMNECVGRSTEKPDLICRDGYFLRHGICSINSPFVDPVIDCAIGSFDKEKMACVEIIHMEPNRRCKKGFALSDNECIGESMRDAQLICPENYKLVHENHKKAKKHGEMVCRRDIVREAVIECPNNGRLHNQKCLITNIEAPIRICSHGMQITEDELDCIKEKAYNPALVCPDGTKLENGICIEEVFNEAEYLCDQHDDRLVDNICQRYMIYDLKVDCNLARNRKHSSCRNSKQILPDLFCDGTRISSRNSVLNYEKKRVYLIDEKCIIEERSSPLYYCPEGEVVGKKCQTLVDVGAALVKCPHGTELDSQDRCVKKKVIPATLTCPTGTVPDNSGIYCEEQQNMKNAFHKNVY